MAISRKKNPYYFLDKDDIEEEVGNDVHATPIGTHFGEAGERLRSARTRGKSAVPGFESRPGSKLAPLDRKPSAPPELTEEEKEVEKHIINDDNNHNGIAGNDEEVDIW